MTAIAQMDDALLEAEQKFFTGFKGVFDLREAEMQQIAQKGQDWGIALDIIGEEYAKYFSLKKVK